jgi:hypothetical protein
VEDWVRAAEDADEGFRNTLRDLLRSGEDIPPGKSASLSSAKASREILHYGVRVFNPRERLTRSLKNFNMSGAVARFVWMMALTTASRISSFIGETASPHTLMTE